jgi:hypothetical protein
MASPRVGSLRSAILGYRLAGMPPALLAAGPHSVGVVVAGKVHMAASRTWLAGADQLVMAGQR